MMRTLTERLAALLAAAALAVAAAGAGAGEAPGYAELSTYQAQYRLSTRGITLDVTRQLKESGDGSFTLSQGGKNLVASIHEMSAFRVEDTRIVPKSFVYQLRAPFVNRRREVHFTPGSETIRSLYKDKWYDLPYTEGTLDRMSQQEQLRLFLLNDPTPKEDFTVPVADGKRIKNYDFIFVAEETVQTALGELRTLHFRRAHDDPERKSDTWIAPELGYLIVKAMHIEDGSPTELVITSVDVEGGQ
jgi:hypothetical protein